MKALSITNAQITRTHLLEMAEEIPGAWIGIRIAALFLLLSGWKSTEIASLFGLSRWSIVKWIYKANEEGVESIRDKQRPGRPPRVTESYKQALDQALQKSPRDLCITMPKLKKEG